MQLVKHNATRADLDALPPNLVGELIDGTLYVMARPRAPHGIAATWIITEIGAPYVRGRGGPGGWWIIVEPGIELPGAAEVVPDLGGWRKERMPLAPTEEAITTVPDWVCEIQSDSTAEVDYAVKMPFYARVGVPWLWMLSPKLRFLAVHRLVEGRWVLHALHEGNSRAFVPPFDAVQIDLGGLWTEIPFVAADSGR